DWSLYIFCARHGSVHFINEVMGIYRIHAGGLFGSLTPLQQNQQMIEYLEDLNGKLGSAYESDIRESVSSIAKHIRHLEETSPSARTQSKSAKRDDSDQSFKKLAAAVWPMALMVGRGEDARLLLDNLGQQHDSDIDEDELARIIFIA